MPFSCWQILQIYTASCWRPLPYLYLRCTLITLQILFSFFALSSRWGRWIDQSNYCTSVDDCQHLATTHHFLILWRQFVGYSVLPAGRKLVYVVLKLFFSKTKDPLQLPLWSWKEFYWQIWGKKNTTCLHNPSVYSTYPGRAGTSLDVKMDSGSVFFCSFILFQLFWENIHLLHQSHRWAWKKSIF